MRKRFGVAIAILSVGGAGELFRQFLAETIKDAFFSGVVENIEHFTGIKAAHMIALALSHIIPVAIVAIIVLATYHYAIWGERRRAAVGAGASLAPAVPPPGGGDKTEQNLLQIQIGTGNGFEHKKAAGLYKLTHKFSVAVHNSSLSNFISNCKLYLNISSEDKSSTLSHLLVDSFTLNPTESRFVDIVMYNEPATPSGYKDDHIRLLLPIGGGYSPLESWPWSLPVGSYVFSLVAISKETGPCEVVCKIWVDDGFKLHFEKA